MEHKVSDRVRSKKNGNEGELRKVREVFKTGTKRNFGTDWDSGEHNIHGNVNSEGPYHDRSERRRRTTATHSRERRSNYSDITISGESDRSSINSSESESDSDSDSDSDSGQSDGESEASS
jgi:hypothetical protein